MSIVNGAAAQGTATGEQAAVVREGRGRPRPRSRIRGGPQHGARAGILVLSGLLEWPLRFEARLIAGGGRIPAGLSLATVFRKGT